MRFFVSVLAPLCFLVPAFAQEPIKAVASFSILGDLVTEVCGEHCVVTTIVGPDADAHIYEPSMADAIAVAEADIIFVNALGFETWSTTLIDNSGTGAETINVNVASDRLYVDGEVDPHAWNDPQNAVAMMTEIAKALGQLVPSKQTEFDRNRQASAQRLMTSLTPVLARIESLPVNRKTVVTAHDAFGYLGRATGLTFLAPVGIDGESEPSAQQLAALIEQIKSTEAAALFVENVNTPELVRQIGDETGLSIGGRLFSDALSEKGGPAHSYRAMMVYNLTAILSELEK